MLQITLQDLPAVPALAEPSAAEEAEGPQADDELDLPDVPTKTPALAEDNTSKAPAERKGLSHSFRTKCLLRMNHDRSSVHI